MRLNIRILVALLLCLPVLLNGCLGLAAVVTDSSQPESTEAPSESTPPSPGHAETPSATPTPMGGGGDARYPAWRPQAAAAAP